MTRGELRFTRVIRSRGIAFLIAIASVIMTMQAWVLGKVLPITSDMSVALPAPSEWLGNSWISMWINVGLLLGLSILLIAINRTTNLLRTISVFFAAFFLLSTASTPIVTGQLSASVPLAIIVIMCMWIMFSIYSVRASSRRVFLVFFLLSLGALLQYTFLLYVPVFIIGLGQMRILKFKKLIAALLGLITPPWIVWGLGIVPLPTMPRFFFTPPTMLLGMEDAWPFIATVTFTLLVGFFVGVINLIKIIGFNAQARAYNGLMMLISIATGIFAIINFTNLPFYVTLLNACVAFQIGHFFRITAMKRGYIFIVSCMVIYIALYSWTILS